MSQGEIAKLTGVGRSQWSMYEIGQRDIPLSSNKVLSDLLIYLQKSEAKFKAKEEIIANENKKSAAWLQQHYLEHQHKAKLLECKIHATEKMRTSCFAAIEVVHYLESHPENITFAALVLDIKDRVEKSLSKNSLHQLQQLQLKKHTIEQQGEWLVQKLKSMQNEVPEDFV